MAQGKLKVKSKLPDNMKTKKKHSKGPAVSKRANKPIQPKKHKLLESYKLKKMVSKNVNHAVEDEMRSRASAGKKTFSNVEKAISAHHKEQTASTST